MNAWFKTLWTGCLAAGLIACIGGAALADDWGDHDHDRGWHGDHDRARVVVTGPSYYYPGYPGYYYYAPPPPVVYAPPPPPPSIDLVFPIHIH